MTPRLLYVLHSGNLYGTERMALATLEGLRDDLESLLCAPPGPIHAEAGRRGIPSTTFGGALDLARIIRRELARHEQLDFIATAITHSAIVLALRAIDRRPGVHLHLVHGGTDERDSYGRKRLLNRTHVTLVAVSSFVRERLIAHGVKPERIQVIENFLPPSDLAARPRRARFEASGIQRALIVSRVDPIKRVDLILDALDRYPNLKTLQIRVLGTGWELETLRERARVSHPNLVFVGFSDEVPSELARTDLLLHLCPVEPFGLAILEAMAAGVPVLVPSTGGASDLVVDGVSGLHFRANDADALGQRLTELQGMDPVFLNRLVAAADAQLATRFAAAARIADYRRVLLEAWT